MLISNWNQKLVRWAIEQRHLPFEWGVTDCGSLVRRGLELITGAPVLNVPNYSDEAEAERVMKKLGPAAQFFESHGAKADRLNRAASGDVVIRPGVDDGLPRLAFVLYPEAVLTSDPENGPHVIRSTELRKRSLLYKFAL